MRSGTPSVHQASTETGHEASLVMSTRASGTPADDRDSTEADPAASLGITVVSKITSAHQASMEIDRGASSAISTSEKPRGEPAMVETFTPRVGAGTFSSKIDGTSHDGRNRTSVAWGQGMPLRPSMNTLRPSDSVSGLAAPEDPTSRPTSRPLLSQASVSEAISKLLREKASIQKTRYLWIQLSE